MPAQSRDFGRGWRPGGTPGIQTRHSPGLGRCPGGTPSVAAVLAPTASAPGVGATMIVLLTVRVQARGRVVMQKLVVRRCFLVQRIGVTGFCLTIAPLTTCVSGFQAVAKCEMG